VLLSGAAWAIVGVMSSGIPSQMSSGAGQSQWAAAGSSDRRQLAFMARSPEELLAFQKEK